MNRFLTSLLMLVTSIAWSDSGMEVPMQEPDNLPSNVQLVLNINKIYEIRPMDESFDIDAYLATTWEDQRAAAFVDEDREYITLEDEQIEPWQEKLWLPALEIINILGVKEVSNKRLIIYKNGRVSYDERFSATLQSQMDFRKFPFDQQIFKIVIEPFSYAASKIKFTESSRVYPSENDAWPMLEWRVVDRTCWVGDRDYDYLLSSTAETKFAQFAFALTVERIPDYFLTQILLPLIVIMLCSWSVFFVKDGATQLSLISTLMLTVYAFNFFVADSLPKLPYSTFLGKAITISFIAIFLQLITHVIELRREKEFSARQNALIAALFVVAFCVTNVVSWHSSSVHATSSVAASSLNMRSCR